jgi:hypothetical protein
MGLDVDKLSIGPARLYVGGTNPASGAVVSVDASGVPGNNGVEVGLTEGPATFHVAGDIREVFAEQALAPLRAVQESEEVTLTFTLKEIDFAKLQRYLRGSNFTSTPTHNNVTGGGNACISSFVADLVHWDVCDGVSIYTIIHLHKAFMNGPFDVSFSKGEESMVEVELKGLADVTRAAGDQVYQISQRKG